MNSSNTARAFLAAMLVGTAFFLAEARAGAQCVGDCNGDGTVGINELILGVNIALGSQPTSACAAFQDGSGMVTIAQLIKGVNDALAMCPVAPTPTVGTPAPTEVVDTPTETSTPVPTVTPGGTPVCGNGIIEPGETCDDGNTMDGDNCPADCVIHDCQFTATTLNVDTAVQLPGAATPGVLQVFLRYPDGVVGLPGHGPDAINVISNVPDDAFTTTVNDVDYGVRVIVLGPDGLTLGASPAGLLFSAQFTLCGGASAPVAADFHCTVENATTVDNVDVTSTSSCSVTLP
jgi:cysteine-rich repeat protein